MRLWWVLCAMSGCSLALDLEETLDGAVLDGAVLDGAVLDGAVLDAAVLDGAALDQGDSRVEGDVDMAPPADAEAMIEADRREPECPAGACPQLIAIEGGRFAMGSAGGEADELPVHEVRVAGFELSRASVTVEQYRGCVEAGGCTAPAAAEGCNWALRGRDEHPVNCVGWAQARDYAEWLGARLPTEAEWEYAARGGGRDQTYPWGEAEPDCERAVMQGCGEGTQPVCAHPAGNTAHGLCDLAGNLWDWVEDDSCDYAETPRDGSAASCGSVYRVVRGGNWGRGAADLRAASRGRGRPEEQFTSRGFRVARSSAGPGPPGPP